MVRKTLLLCTAAALFAQEDISSLTSQLAKITQKAFLTKENELYEPHIVSVYKGSDLEKLGIQNLKEALEFVPGVDIYGDNLDIKTAIFRGSNPFAYGQSKLFIDGVLVNDTMFDQYSNYLDMPIELIKRIEVIRGPGSKAEGYNAFAGSIYVTTYAEDRDSHAKVFIKTGSYRTKVIGGYKNFIYKDLSGYLELYYHDDHKKLFAGPDALASGAYDYPNQGISNRHLASSGDVPMWLKNFSFATTLRYKDFTLRIRDNHYKHGAAFGISNIRPLMDDYLKLPSRIAELSYHTSWKTNDLSLRIGRKIDGFFDTSRVAPPGLVYHIKTSSYEYNKTFAHGFFGTYETKQHSDYLHLDLQNHAMSHHTINIGIILAHDKTKRVRTITTNLAPGPDENLVDYSSLRPFMNPHAKRIRQIIYLSDAMALSPKLDLYAGINYEKVLGRYHQLNPRASMVYRLDSSNIVKFLASRSHRDPSWQELYTINNTTRVGNEHLHPEIVYATELSYIKKLSTDDYLQMSLFYLRNKDLIDNINPSREFRNSGKNHIYGLELEMKKSLDVATELYGNYSYVFGHCGKGRPLNNVATHMAKFAIKHAWSARIATALTGRYVGKKRRSFYDTREALDSYFDLGASIDWHWRQWDMMLSAKNLLDADIRYPSKPMTYINDYPTTKGRTFLFAIRGNF